MNSRLWLVVASVFGFGGPGIATYLGNTDPSWCSEPFVGCLGAMFLFAVGGWLLGLVASAFSLRAEGKLRVVSWIMFAWNGIGVFLCVVLVLAIVLRR
jgi:hypothetical protein